MAEVELSNGITDPHATDERRRLNELPLRNRCIERMSKDSSLESAINDFSLFKRNAFCPQRHVQN